VDEIFYGVRGPIAVTVVAKGGEGTIGIAVDGVVGQTGRHLIEEERKTRNV